GAWQAACVTLWFLEVEPRWLGEDRVRCCGLVLGGRPAGRAALVSLESRLRVDERMRTLAIGLLAIDLTGLNPDAVSPKRLTPPPMDPEVELDFSFVGDARRRYAQLSEDLRLFKDPMLRRLHFVDAYEGGSIPEGRRSLTIRAVLGAADRTLADADLTRFRGEFSKFL